MQTWHLIHNTPFVWCTSLFPFTKLECNTALSVCVCVSVNLSEEGGHPDGSPLLRISDKQGGHGGKKARVGLYQEGGHEDEYSGGGQQRTVMIIRAPSGYADEATHVAFSEKKRGKSSGASSGATPSGAGRSIYQDVNESYAFSFYDDNDDEHPSMSVSL